MVPQRRRRRLLAVALLCLIAAACRQEAGATRAAATETPSGTSSAVSVAALPAPPTSGDASAQPAGSGVQHAGSALQVPAEFAVTSRNFGVRVLYTWTTDDQIAALRRAPVLLTRTESPTLGASGYTQRIRSMARANDPLGILLSEPRFARGRHAWVNAFGAAAGTGGEKYGKNLIGVTLKPDA